MFSREGQVMKKEFVRHGIQRLVQVTGQRKISAAIRLSDVRGSRSNDRCMQLRLVQARSIGFQSPAPVPTTARSSVRRAFFCSEFVALFSTRENWRGYQS